MITIRIKRGLKCSIPFEGTPTEAKFGEIDWLHKYRQVTKAFALDYADTEDLNDGIFTIKDGKSVITYNIKVI